MTVEDEEYLDTGSLAERLEVCSRTIERLIDDYAKKLKRSRRRQGHKIVYLWSEVLHCAKLHTGIETENAPSVAVKRAYTKQRIKELEAEVERLRQENEAQQQPNNNPSQGSNQRG